MRIFCIHCGAANTAGESSCVSCRRLILPCTAPAPNHQQLEGPSLPGAAAPRPVPLPVPIAMPPMYGYPVPAGAATPPGPPYEPYDYPQQEMALTPYAAGFGPRMAAMLVDLMAGGVAISFIFVLLGILQLALDLSDVATGSLALLALVGWWPLYFIGLWTRDGRTLGYRMAGLQLVKNDGGQPSFGTSVVRFAGAICSLAPFLLGYLWMLWDNHRQTWHDKMAGTMVVRE